MCIIFRIVSYIENNPAYIIVILVIINIKTFFFRFEGVRSKRTL